MCQPKLFLARSAFAIVCGDIAAALEFFLRLIYGFTKSHDVAAEALESAESVA